MVMTLGTGAGMAAVLGPGSVCGGYAIEADTERG